MEQNQYLPSLLSWPSREFGEKSTVAPRWLTFVLVRPNTHPYWSTLADTLPRCPNRHSFQHALSPTTRGTQSVPTHIISFLHRIASLVEENNSQGFLISCSLHRRRDKTPKYTKDKSRSWFCPKSHFCVVNHVLLQKFLLTVNCFTSDNILILSLPFKFPPVFLKFCNLIRKALPQKDQNWTWFKRIQLISTNMTGVGRILIAEISFLKRKLTWLL